MEDGKSVDSPGYSHASHVGGEKSGCFWLAHISQ